MTAAAVLRKGASPWPALLDAASAPYRRAGRFAWKFARGKLGIDPVFRYLLSTGQIVPNARVLDIGCGQGLLASLLRECAPLSARGHWPSGWAVAPSGARVTGIELMERDVQRARAALGGAAEFICGDMRHTPFPAVDAVVILDVLHYVSVPEQDAVLSRVRDALPLGGRLLMRVCDMASPRRYRVSLWVDAIVTVVRGHRALPRYGRTLSDWMARLEALGFTAHSVPMSQGTPFANVLLIGHLRHARDERRVAMGHEEAHFEALGRPAIPLGDRTTYPSAEGHT